MIKILIIFNPHLRYIDEQIIKLTTEHKLTLKENATGFM